MITLLKRLGTELKTRGPIGLIRFLALRLLQWRADVLYELDLTQGAATKSTQNSKQSR